MKRALFMSLRLSDAHLRKRFCVRQYVQYCKSGQDIMHFISENTEIVRGQSLTPEISLRLFTPKCRFWTERPELWPFPEPFWAIYWPGGQALARYLLNKPEVSAGKRVLDLGCGCGASAIAAKLSGATHVLANDIDPVAAIATQMNCELNGLEPLPSVTENMIGSKPENWDLILLGDMFYDETLADCLHNWLHTCIKIHRTQILIGDPGRAQFESHSIKKLLHEQAQFELPDSVKEENYGLTSSTVWCYRPA
ncbi:electron transfer flavoprotein beta subunit lysine methyltransferase [Pygocentrus nattereri]|uniref:Electron transfer flavoprotein beta subunit lysine methyltransferase n=1 Tax=Pygocentrus nattereri TaxID=42514 RepID=A0A3B4DZW4_PYGNA|nr:electron transfer flavoprotein beta subunit lysine methyltransferase [Pygocentrus nattereri]